VGVFLGGWFEVPHVYGSDFHLWVYHFFITGLFSSTEPSLQIRRNDLVHFIRLQESSRSERYLQMICPMRNWWRQRCRKVLRYGGGESSRWDERCMHARWLSDAQVSIGNEKEFVKSVRKVNRTLKVKKYHPYIGVYENNCLSEVWRFIRRSLEDTYTVSDAWGCA